MNEKQQRLLLAADMAYSEMAFAVQDLSGLQLDRAVLDRRAKRLAKAADELRAALDALPFGK